MSTGDVDSGIDIEPFEDSFYLDEIVVYSLVTVTNAENIDTSIDGDPSPPVKCTILDPTSARAVMPGVDPRGSELIMIYCNDDPKVDSSGQLIEVVKAQGRELESPKRLRSTKKALVPVGYGSYYVIEADWESR